MNQSRISSHVFEPRCQATTIGSLPHTDVSYGTRLMLHHTPDIPGWAQFPNRSHRENMMIQFTEGMPGLVKKDETVYFDMDHPDFINQITDFFSLYLAVVENQDNHALESFALTQNYAAGFPELIKQLSREMRSRTALKGQVTGPFTLGMNLLDQNGKCAYYDDQLRDIIIKTTALKAVWEIQKLSEFNPRTIVLIDEPSLLNFGTQLCITVSREDIMRDLNEVAGAIHSSGGLAGVHCEANTDWSILMETDLDILVFDAYDHMQAITLYPEHLLNYLKRGGSLGWGIVPTLDKDAAANEKLESLRKRFEKGMDQLVRKGFEKELLLKRALITPSCGTGGVLDEPLAERVLGLLARLSESLRRDYSFA